MQLYNDGYWPERSLSYTCRSYDNLNRVREAELAAKDAELERQRAELEKLRAQLNTSQ